MIEIKEILKKDILEFIETPAYWNTSFFSVSKHRLYAHYKNPTCDDNDVVLLLGYLNNELVGYMGVFMDEISLNNKTHKIGWLSTWWVHPKTKGSGIGRKILETMYEVNNGKIGISQFTPSAKRVYDKSGYFTTLKENIGIKAVMRSSLSFIVLHKFPKLTALQRAAESFDGFANIFINLKLSVHKKSIQKKLNNVTLEYLTHLDKETFGIINKYNKNHISPKSTSFFEWLKLFNWVQEAPLLKYTEKEKYAFSIYDTSFSIHLIKIKKNNVPVGFLVLQKRNKTIKVLFSYHDATEDSAIIANIIKLHGIQENVRELICYQPDICNELIYSNIFLYKRKKNKHSIISSVYNETNFDDLIMNFGDGDCSFA